MNNKVKILAYYLPQFHEIPENNKWWGEGFTEWVNVKKAQPLFEGHQQPKIPMNQNYYDLSDVDVMRWQANIARENGLYGFCFYHYWFSERPLLEKPLENYLMAEDIELPYCFCWANESWTNGWAKAESSVIMEQKYGDKKEWNTHFDYLLKYFKDPRYIKEDNCPLLVIYRPYLYPRMTDMLDYWKKLAKENGFDGIKIASQRFEEPEKYKNIYEYLDYHISYEPKHVKNTNKKPGLWKKIRSLGHDLILKVFNKDISIHQAATGPVKFDYDEMWQNILNRKATDSKDIAGAFVNWDNTPRHSRRGSVYINVTPEKFEKYMGMQLENVNKNYDTDYLFLFAWNEWGEGGVMEPDENDGDAYLKALRRVSFGE